MIVNKTFNKGNTTRHWNARAEAAIDANLCVHVKMQGTQHHRDMRRERLPGSEQPEEVFPGNGIKRFIKINEDNIRSGYWRGQLVCWLSKLQSSASLEK